MITFFASRSHYVVHCAKTYKLAEWILKQNWTTD